MKKILLVISVIGLTAGSASSVENLPSSNQAASVGTSSSVDREQLIGQLLAISGLKKTLQQLQDQVNPSIGGGSAATGEEAEFQKEVVKLYLASYPKDGFVNRVKDVLRRNYDEKRYSHFMQLLSTPLSRRMVDLESAEPTPADFQNYVSQVSLRPLSSDRIQLIQRLDSATHSSAMLTAITIASIESNAIAMSEDCIVNETKIRKEIEGKRSEIEKATRSRAQITLAFTYRDVADADLSKYIKTYEDKDSQWLQAYVQEAIEEQFESGIKKVGYGMKQLVQSHKPKKTMFAPKCKGEEPVNDDNAHGKHPVSKAHYSIKNRDLRECLKLEDSIKIIACTEKAHKAH